MKRRNVIKGAGSMLAGIPIVAQSQIRRFGEPGSIGAPKRQARLHLSLAKADIPIEFWEPLERIDALWQSVTTEADAQKAFRRDPSAVFAMHGIDPQILSGADRESRVLRALLDPQVAEALRRRDYSAFINQLQAVGLHPQAVSSGLVQKLTKAFRADAEKYRRLVASGAALTGGTESAESAVRLASGVPTISLVWFAITVIVMVDAVAVVVVIAVVAGREPNSNLLRTTSRVAPEQFEQVADANRVARLYGAPEIQVELVRNAVRAEVEAIVLAAEGAGVADFRGQSRKDIVESVTSRILQVSV